MGALMDKTEAINILQQVQEQLDQMGCSNMATALHDVEWWINTEVDV
jgi:hypothetical protein